MDENAGDALPQIGNIAQYYKKPLSDVMVEYFKREHKNKVLMALPDEDKNVLMGVMNCVSFVSAGDIRAEEENPEFHAICRLLKKGKSQGVFDQVLLDIYKRKRAETYNYIRIKRGRISKEVLGKQFNNYQRIKKEKPDVASVIFKESIEKATRTAKDNFAEIEKIIMMFEHNLFGLRLAPTLFNARVDNIDIIKAAAVLILHPKYSIVGLLHLEKEWGTFPLKWFFMQKTIPENRYIYSQYKKGVDVSYVFRLQYEDLKFSNLNTLLKDKLLAPPFSHILCCRHDVIKEVMACYRKKLYAATICTALTLIEGMLWDFSKEYDFSVGEIYKDYNEDTVILSTGKNVSEINIGMLLKQTAFSNALDINFIDYFCGELYAERNPILHGRDTALFDKNNAAKKIATIEYILTVVNDFYEKKVMQTLNEAIPKEITEKVLSALDEKKSKK